MAKGKTAVTETSVETPSAPTNDIEALKQQLALLTAQNQALLANLAITQAVAARKDDIGEPNLRVENVSGMAVAFTVHDPRTGQPVNVSLDRRGAFRGLYRRQVEELVENHPHFFERGLLSAQDVTPDNVNVMRDPKAFVESCTYDTAQPRVSEITSIDTLFTLYHFIETLRWQHEDERGLPLTEKGDDGKDVPSLKERTLPPTYTAVHLAVQRRIAEVKNVNTRLDG